MAKEIVDRRVLRILRWSLVVQIIFLFQNSFSPRLYRLLQGSQQSINWVSILPIIVITFLLILLSITQIQNKITKSVFLAMLYLIAIMTILSRNRAVTGDFFGPPGRTAILNLFRGGWETIFFLIIPLVFIAWQFSMREVIIYCVAIVFFESAPLAFPPKKENDPLFPMINFLSDIARSLTMLIVGWIMHQLVKVQRDQQLQLLEANKKLRNYALTNEKLAQTQERNRLARELHDTLAHTLSSVSVQLEATKALFDRDPVRSKKILDETLTNTKNGLIETRRTLIDLRASALESYGLAQAIRNLGTSTAERGGFEITFNLEKELDVIPDDIAHSLYRTVQEALENVLRHANATQVAITLKPTDGAIRLEISDDGHGFITAEVNDQKLGIRGMQERIEMLGGKFEIRSSEQTGTTILVELDRHED